MEITEIRINTINKEGTLVKAIASITIDDAIAIHGIKVRTNRDGTNYYISMPCKKDKEHFVDIVHPINNETRNILSRKILDSYYAMTGLDVSTVTETDDQNENEEA